ncbi:MAG: RNase H-like domain-containing protein [Sedimenticola sp.]
MIDTGSVTSLLSDSMLGDILVGDTELQPIGPTLKLTTADGAPLDIKGKVVLQFSLDDLVFEHEFFVANIDLPGLLGIDFLEQYDIGIKTGSALLHVGDRTVDLERNDSEKCARVKLSKGVIIPPDSEMVVRAYVKGQVTSDCEMMLEPFKTMGRKGLLVSNAVVNPDSVQFSVINVSKKPVQLKQHSLVGSLAPVTTVQQVDLQNDLKGHQTHVPEHLKPLLDQASDSLTCEQKQSLQKLIVEYQDVFMSPDGELGRTDLVKHTIDTGNARPIKIPPRRVAQKQKTVIENEINKMLENDIIEPSNSPWSSPILLVSKKDWSIRFCIDYRKLNAVTIKDAYPLPRMDDSLDALSGSKWFSTLDLVSAYWQTEINESDRPKMAFSSHKGLFHFKVLPYGLSNAPAVFERLMELVLRGLTWERCLCYLDDVIVFGKTFEEALYNLESVLQRFRTASLKLKPSKCALFQTQVSFLGHVVSESGISCDPKKIVTITNWPVPTNISEVKSFLGLVGYYRRFVPDFSTVAYPLTQLTHKAAKFAWSDDCQQAFETLKHTLTSSPILAYPIESGDFILDTDASLTGLGAVLSQIQDGEEKVIAYASRTLSKSQQRYCTTYRELLAVVTFVKLFRHYLWGRHFIVRSDHSSLKWLQNFKNTEGMIARWITVLSTYDFNIEFRRGKAHANADTLSRKPHRICKNPGCLDCLTARNDHIVVPDAVSHQKEINDGDKDDLPSITHQAAPVMYQSESGLGDNAVVDTENTQEFKWIQSWSNDEIKHWQSLDSSINRIIELKGSFAHQPPRNTIVSDSSQVKTMWSLWDSLIIEDGILKYKWQLGNDDSANLLLVAPVELRSLIFTALHCNKTAGHLGRRRTIDNIRKRFFWPGMSSQIRRWVRQCDLCCRRKSGPGLGRSPLQQSKPCYPLSRIAIDILECPLSDNGNRYIIVVCDYFTKWTEAYPVKDHTAITVADKLITEFISRFGVPDEIHSDQGGEFESKLFARLCEMLRIDLSQMGSSNAPIELLSRCFQCTSIAISPIGTIKFHLF